MNATLKFFCFISVVTLLGGCARAPKAEHPGAPASFARAPLGAWTAVRGRASKSRIPPVEPVAPNPNTAPAGSRRDGVLTVRLEARLGAWRPDADVDSAVTVQAFAEEGKSPEIPGPLLRASQGTEVRVTIRNLILDSTLIVHGLRAGTLADDTLQVAPGTTREVLFRATKPGTYLYWGTTSGATIADRWARDGQLTGAIVIDPLGAGVDPHERIFVITVIDIYADSTRPPTKEDIWEVAINGRSWPHTERLRYDVGDTVRWRWINGSDRSHPMHLHGFHFRMLAKGSRFADTAYAANATRLAVTEFMMPGSSFRMEWIPTRAGNWLMHCHMLGHITPFPTRADTLRRHDAHDVTGHPLSAMAGLVLGITTAERVGAAEPVPPMPKRRLRLLAQQAGADSGKPAPRGFVLQRGAEPRADSVDVPGSPLVLVRGETAAITVVNRLTEPTSVHWHGMELESLYDGVPGWSGTGARRAPLIAPGDSFTVTLTPPRAGTYMYHTHMDEEDQLPAGMYGPMLVLEPGERYEPATDRTFMVGEAVVRGLRGPAVNGQHAPEPITLRIGTRYRLRLINMLPVEPVRMELLRDSVPTLWRAIAKDGAALPAARQTNTVASIIVGVGETYDFEWTPASLMDASLIVKLPGSGRPLRQTIRVRE